MDSQVTESRSCMPVISICSGFTLIGMHLRRVAVPLRLENDKIGEAKVLSARTRPKFIGGCRAVYDEAKQ